MIMFTVAVMSPLLATPDMLKVIAVGVIPAAVFTLVINPVPTVGSPDSVLHPR